MQNHSKLLGSTSKSLQFGIPVEDMKLNMAVLAHKNSNKDDTKDKSIQ